MPLPYLLFHLMLAVLCGWLATRFPPRSVPGWVLGGVGLVLVLGGLAVERRSEWAWDLLGLPWADLVFFTNFSLQGVTVLLVRVWGQSQSRFDYVRAAILSLAALGAAGWSYAWYFAPAPRHLTGTPDTRGFCPQTTSASCGAAATVMLLHRHGIPTTEREMADLCLTRAGIGTAPLGMKRGLTLKGADKGLAPRLVSPGSVARLAELDTPAILSVGLKRSAPEVIVQEMARYGWQPGMGHAVVCLRADPGGRWLLIADPSNGLERWPTRHLEWLWDGRALILAPP